MKYYVVNAYGIRNFSKYVTDSKLEDLASHIDYDNIQALLDSWEKVEKDKEKEANKTATK